MTFCAERGGNEAAGVEACYTHRSKALSRLPLHTSAMKERRGKSGKEGHKGRVEAMQVLLSETASAAPSLPA